MPQTNNQNTKSLYTEQSTLLVSTNLKVLLTFVIGVVVAILAVYLTSVQYLELMQRRAETVAAVIDPARVSSIIKNDSNAKANEAYIKKQLQHVRGINTDARFYYLMGITNTNDVYFLVDSEPHESQNYSPRGQAYPEATEALKAAFYTGKTFVEGPLKDRWGTWLSAVAPVSDTKGKQIAVLGMDILPSTYFSVLAAAAVIPIAGIVLVSTLFITTDTIRRRRQESVRMRSELVSIASHELRTPLTGIRWGEESLLEKELIKESRDTLQSMYDSTIRLQESIEDILQLANWQAGRKQELTLTTTDIGELFAGIFATQKLPAAQNNIHLKFAPSWPDKLFINCDAQRMKRVMNNLLSNAIKYAKPNTSVVVGYEKVDGSHVITIKDHGIGIPKSEQKKVFAGFYRASNAVSHEASGTGMGLYMSRNAIEQHGGKLWLKSTEGKGTTVYIQLP